MGKGRSVPSMQLMRNISPAMEEASDSMYEFLSEVSGKLTGAECVTLMVGALSTVVKSLGMKEEGLCGLLDKIAETIKVQQEPGGLPVLKSMPCTGCGKPTLVPPDGVNEVIVCKYCAEGKERKDD